jgi:DmsE family decaheme c-type cytochrome
MDRPPRPAKVRAATLACAIASVVCSIVACTAGGSGEDRRFEWSPEDRACIECHADAGHDLLESRAHEGRAQAVGCLGCHIPHGLDAERHVVGTGRTVACETCHAEVAAQFRLPFTHRLGEGVACTSCHSPHGGNRRDERIALRETACTGCHVEYRGPFVFRHEADDTQRCLSCHEPHGSSNRRMLTYATTRDLCTSCHANLELIHTQEPGSLFVKCVACHVQVHGSNWDKQLFR